jgi:ABC-type uncharacterized transport system permease subunit
MCTWAFIVPFTFMLSHFVEQGGNFQLLTRGIFTVVFWDLILWWMQEGVAVEIAEAVVGALAGELAATAVNAPMVPAEVHRWFLILFQHPLLQSQHSSH